MIPEHDDNDSNADGIGPGHYPDTPPHGPGSIGPITDLRITRHGDRGGIDLPDEEETEPSFTDTGLGHHVMDRADIQRVLTASGVDGEDGLASLSGAEEQRARLLIGYRDSNLWRRHVIGTPAMVVRLHYLQQAQPNFAPYLKLVRRAAELSMVSATPLRIQPTILVGPPGIGKSRLVRDLARVLGSTCEVINGSTLPDVGSLTGYPPVWRGSGPGRLAKALIAAATSSPVLFVDEATRINDYESSAYPLDRMLTLLEVTTASAFSDECLNVPMRGQHAVVVLACNDMNGFSDAFLDRAVILEIEDLRPEQRDAALEAMLGEVGSQFDLCISFANRSALEPLRDLGLRRSRLALEIAIGVAVADQRRFLTHNDLATAVRLLQRPKGRAATGFITPRA